MLTDAELRARVAAIIEGRRALLAQRELHIQVFEAAGLPCELMKGRARRLRRLLGDLPDRDDDPRTNLDS